MTTSLKSRILALLLLLPLATHAQTTTEMGTGLIEDAVVPPTEQTTVSVGVYVLRLNKVSPRDGSFDVDM